MADLTIPDGSTLLHIGPHKTGTTTIQNALGENRDRLREQGVIYPGRLNHEMDTAMAVALGFVDPGKNFEAFVGRFDRWLAEIRAAEPRLAVFSSEFYADTKPERIPALLDRFERPVHVVITLRPIVRILASQWQQYMQNRMTYSFEEWLHAILDKPLPGKVTPSFWRRHRHDLLVKRWLDHLGPDRLSIVVVDERDHGFLTRSFEQLLGVESGTLVPSELRSNRSLTWEEVELLRAFNKRYKAAGGTADDYTRLIRFGAIREVQQGPPVGHKIRTPQWAIDRISELGAQMAAEIASYGVPVLGSLRDLADPSLAPEAGDNPPIAFVDVELAARLAAGLAHALGWIPGEREDRRVPGVVEQATAMRHRAANVVTRPGWADALRRDIANVERAMAEVERAAQAPRRAALRELARRAGLVRRR